MTKAELDALLPCPCCCSTNLVGGSHANDCVYCKDCWLRAVSPAAWNTRTGQLVPREAVDLVGANTLPTEYARWLSSIEVDVRVHDLTADEVARLVAALAPSREAVEGAVEALTELRAMAPWGWAGVTIIETALASLKGTDDAD